jgi:SAM-dependent methyltransferase
VDPSESSRPRTALNISAYFGRLAGTYGDGAYYGNRRKAVVDAIAGEIADARDMLDVGCGNGAYLTKFLEAPGNRTVTGVDLTFDMLLSARQRVGPKCRLVNADVSRLPFKAASFDFIFASHVLQFVGDVEGVVAEFARCIQAGGVMIATGQRDDSVRQMLSVIVGPERWRGNLPARGAARSRCASQGSLPAGVRQGGSAGRGTRGVVHGHVAGNRGVDQHQVEATDTRGRARAGRRDDWGTRADGGVAEFGAA